MKRYLLYLVLALALASQTACPFATANNAIDNILLNTERAARYIDRSSEMVHELYCPTCETHFLKKETELQLQQNLLTAQEKLARAYGALRASGIDTGKITLTPARKADIESNLTALRVGLPTGSEIGPGTSASAKLQGILAPLDRAVSDVLLQLSKVKVAQAGTTFQLSAAQTMRVQSRINHYVTIGLLPISTTEEKAER